jgi:hypothetical protein
LFPRKFEPRYLGCYEINVFERAVKPTAAAGVIFSGQNLCRAQSQISIEKMFMTKAAEQTVVRSISRKREQIATLREELEDLNDYLDLTEARVRDEGKPRLSHAEVKKRYGLK